LIIEVIQNHPYLSAVGIVLLTIAIYDVFQKKHTIKHNFPLLGNLRYILETIGPELRQYWVASDKDEKPFDRSERRWIYATAKNQNSTFGYGTDEVIYEIGYPIIKQKSFPFPEENAQFPREDKTAIPCIKVMGLAHKRKRPFRLESVINLSAMSFGSLGYRAISALNKGALIAGCTQNTGEGGVSPYHLLGADLIWQLGTAYFGARDDDGHFSMNVLLEKVNKYPQIRAIEVKLSQGAKPGKGGILPGKKVTKEISKIRGIPMGVTCLSPNSHSAFNTVDEMIDFIELLAKESGLPVGIKSAVGNMNFWDELANRMKERNQGPDFITIDGGEAGTGAAPLTFADHVSLPFKIGFARVYQTFQKIDMVDPIIWIGSAKLGFPDRAMLAFALGCDAINIGREAMISIGCIQAQRCHADTCPTGVATQNKWLQAGLNIDIKAKRFSQFLRGFRQELLVLSYATGYQHPAQFTGQDIELSVGVNKFSPLEHIMGYKKNPTTFTSMVDLYPTPSWGLPWIQE